jgi:hypothetical protein
MVKVSKKSVLAKCHRVLFRVVSMLSGRRASPFIPVNDCKPILSINISSSAAHHVQFSSAGHLKFPSRY